MYRIQTTGFPFFRRGGRTRGQSPKRQLYTTKHFYKEENVFNPQAQSDPRRNCCIQDIAIRKCSPDLFG